MYNILNTGRNLVFFWLWLSFWNRSKRFRNVGTLSVLVQYLSLKMFKSDSSLRFDLHITKAIRGSLICWALLRSTPSCQLKSQLCLSHILLAFMRCTFHSSKSVIFEAPTAWTKFCFEADKNMGECKYASSLFFKSRFNVSVQATECFWFKLYHEKNPFLIS